MPSDDLKGDAVAVFTEHRDTILAVGGAAVLLLFLLLLFGGLNAVGGIFFLGYALVWLAVLGFVLWLFYRLVTAVERIAAAQERLASARVHESVGVDEGDDEEDDETTVETDDEPDRV